MTIDLPRPILHGQTALVVGIANDSSIAYGCARAFRDLGANVAVTYLNERARPHVEPLAKGVSSAGATPTRVWKRGSWRRAWASLPSG